ncbi:hypothetical protein Tco_0665898 [Tanacetum coccineum]
MDKEMVQELTVITQDASSSADKEKLQELTVINPTPSSCSPLSSLPKPKPCRFRRYKTFIQHMGGRYGYMFAHLKKHFMPRKSFHELARHLYNVMGYTLPLMVGDRVNEIAKKAVPLYVAEGLLLDKQKTQADVAAMITEAVQKERENLHAEITVQVNNAISNNIPPQVDTFLRNYMSNNILYVHPTLAPLSSTQDLQYQLYQMMKNDGKLKRDELSIWWSLKIKFDKSAPSTALCRTVAIRPRDYDDHQDDVIIRKRQKISKHGTYSIDESSSR